MAEEPASQALTDFYANIVNFGATAWDVRLLFGQVIKRGEQEEFEPRVAVTIPWLQAKVMSAYLQLNIFAYEKMSGKIDVPPNLLPSLPQPSPEITDPNFKAMTELLQKKLEQILATMSDLNPP